ncbi:hypothetical protein MLD38_026793 [Melastoma candidum]|uniref:Uncharacterized protein n=1 Tax=Melastoma candidum TaxID=119954 RepID=A0ACB9P4L1_9MYRT|nr:hypothetical protein MLD38_026793 [Melastoma candidum]
MDTTYKVFALFLVFFQIAASLTTTSAAVASPCPAPGPEENKTNSDLFPIRHVRIFNNISSGWRTYTVHCKSGDDDLHLHNIGPNEVFNFKFHPNIWGTTLFYCQFRVEDLGGTFDIYVEKRDVIRCPTMCNWWVRRTSIVGRRQESDVVDIVYDFH